MDNRNNKKKEEEEISPLAVLGGLAAIAGGAFLAFKGASAIAKAFNKEPRIEIINTSKECNDLIVRIKKDCEEYAAVGFDVEYVNNYYGRKPVSMLQLCTHKGLCGLIRLQKLEGIPLELYDLLADRSILKVGVSPYADGKLLYDDYKMKVNGFLDLRHLAQRLPEYRRGRLQDLSETFLNVPPEDTSDITMSDWDAHTLSPHQIDYAAKVCITFELLERKLTLFYLFF